MSTITIIKNGLVIDPKKKRIEKKNIFIKDGKFIDEKELGSLKSEYSIIYIDALGHYVSPGFIDLHTHVFPYDNPLGIAPDLVGIYQGVTTVVDAGSSGIDNYESFAMNVISKTQTRILSFINLSRNGLCKGLSELSKVEDFMSKQEFQEAMLKFDSIVGLKVRLSRSVVKENGNKPLEFLKKEFANCDVPTMVHIGNAPPTTQEVLPLLEKGDIVTHAFHGKPGGILSDNHLLIPEAKEALERGVVFDVGHGTDSFSFKTMERFAKMSNDYFTISTDIYKKNFIHPVQSLAATMTKLLIMGYSLEQVVSSVTSLPAKLLKSNMIGTFDSGAFGDVTIFKLEKTNEELTDSYGVVYKAKNVIAPLVTIKEGEIMMDNTKNDFLITENMRELFWKCSDGFAAEAVYKLVIQEGIKLDISFSKSQKLSIASHVSGMIDRSCSGDTIPEFDKGLFADVPKKYLETSRRIVEYIGKLPEEEMYLLSIHFAGAKIVF